MNKALLKRFAMADLCILVFIAGCAGGTSEKMAELPAPPDQGRPVIASLSESLFGAISKRAQEDGFAGTALVSRHGKTILHQTFGMPAEISAGTEPAYWIASGTKQFMGALIALLVSDGVLDLDAPIGEYLPDVPRDKQQITLRQLLTHTSGLGQRYAAEGITDRDEATQAILKTKLVFKPGSDYSYSNDGFTLAAIIAEVASGQLYETLMRQRMFESVGLQSTGLWGFEGDNYMAPVRASRAVANQSRTIYRNGRSQANWGYRGATGMYSTTRDLAAWLKWLLQAQNETGNPMSLVIAPERLVREADGLGAVYYGLGIAVVKREDSLYMISHIGDDDWLGHNSTVTAYADGDIIVVLSNSGYLADGTPWSAAISRQIRTMLKK